MQPRSQGFSVVNWQGLEKTLASAGHVLTINNSKPANLCNPLDNPFINCWNSPPVTLINPKVFNPLILICCVVNCNKDPRLYSSQFFGIDKNIYFACGIATNEDDCLPKHRAQEEVVEHVTSRCQGVFPSLPIYKGKVPGNEVGYSASPGFQGHARD